MGISCDLRQTKGLDAKEHEPLFKQHMQEDIYRRYYGGTPRAINKKRKHSDDWINKKIENGDELTIAEKKFRTMRRHVEIHKEQPQYKRYLLNPLESPLLEYISKGEIENNKHNRRASR
jgi:23S rRNA-/tRNA-specific pseudouridylate synthase